MPPDESLPSPGDFKFHYPVEVRFRDLDAMGHVNNAAYFTFFEVARTGYMRAIGHASAAGKSHGELFPFILLDISCRFLAPATLGQTLGLHLRTTRAGTKSFHFEYLITDPGGEPVAVGRSTQVYYDYAGARTAPIPTRFRELLSTYEGREI